MKKTLIVLTIILFTGLTAADVTFDDSNNIQFQTGIDLNNNDIVNFYGSACNSDEYITDIQDDGTLVCESISATGSQDLSQVLDEGNIANQAIDMGGNDITDIGAIDAEGNISMLDTTSDPVLDYKFGEGGGYGAFIRYNSQYGGETNDNRLVIGTENDGNDYEIITAERGNGALFAHRTLDMQTNPIQFDNNRIKIGDSIDNQADSTVAIGNGATVKTDDAIAIGTNAYANNIDYTTGQQALAIGYNANASGAEGIAIGSDSKASGGDSMALGEGAQAPGYEGVALSAGDADGDYSFALGYDALTSAGYSVALGYNSEASASQAFAIGRNASALGSDAYAIGEDATATAPDAYALGDEASASGDDSYAIGETSSASAPGAIAIGQNAVSDQQDTVRFGSDTQSYDVDITGDLNVDGSLTGVSTGGTASGLSEVLEVNNTANQSIDVSDNKILIDDSPASDNGVVIGDSDSSTQYGNGVAIGRDTTAGGSYSVAIGQGSETNNNAMGAVSLLGAADYQGVAVGDGASTDNNYQTAVGSNSGVTSSNQNYYGTAVGYGSYSSAEAAVAIGYNANAPNSYEATFGNLNGQELDLNVTGNATIHGSGGLNFVTSTSQGIEIGSSGTTTDSDTAIAVGQNAKAYDSGGVSGDHNIALGDGAVADGTNFAIAVGDATASANSIAMGRSANSGYAGAAYGWQAETDGAGTAIGGVSLSNTGTAGDGSYATDEAVAIGASSDATSEGAVAIGSDANAPNSYEATFGNLNGQELDLNVTGNATIHGSGGLDMPNGIQIGSSSIIEDSTDIVIGRQAEANSGSSYDGDTAIGYQAKATGGYSPTALGRESKATGDYSVALGQFTEAQNSRSVALGYDSVSSASSALAVGHKAEASASGSVAIGRLAVADESDTVEIGSSSQAYDLNVNGGSIAVGGNTQSGLSSGDINASDIYYDTLTAKSPVVSCSAGTDWCEVSEPSEQSHYFVKKSDSFDKDRPRETAVEVVESDVQTVEEFEELREENDRQEQKLQELNSTVQALKSAVCEDNPEKEVCSR